MNQASSFVAPFLFRRLAKSKGWFGATSFKLSTPRTMLRLDEVQVPNGALPPNDASMMPVFARIKLQSLVVLGNKGHNSKSSQAYGQGGVKLLLKQSRCHRRKPRRECMTCFVVEFRLLFLKGTSECLQLSSDFTPHPCEEDGRQLACLNLCNNTSPSSPPLPTICLTRTGIELLPTLSCCPFVYFGWVLK